MSRDRVASLRLSQSSIGHQHFDRQDCRCRLCRTVSGPGTGTGMWMCVPVHQLPSCVRQSACSRHCATSWILVHNGPIVLNPSHFPFLVWISTRVNVLLLAALRAAVRQLHSCVSSRVGGRQILLQLLMQRHMQRTEGKASTSSSLLSCLRHPLQILSLLLPLSSLLSLSLSLPSPFPPPTPQLLASITSLFRLPCPCQIGFHSCRRWYTRHSCLSRVLHVSVTLSLSLTVGCVVVVGGCLRTRQPVRTGTCADEGNHAGRMHVFVDYHERQLPWTCPPMANHSAFPLFLFVVPTFCVPRQIGLITASQTVSCTPGRLSPRCAYTGPRSMSVQALHQVHTREGRVEAEIADELQSACVSVCLPWRRIIFRLLSATAARLQQRQTQRKKQGSADLITASSCHIKLSV